MADAKRLADNPRLLTYRVIHRRLTRSALECLIAVAAILPAPFLDGAERDATPLMLWAATAWVAIQSARATLRVHDLRRFKAERVSDPGIHETLVINVVAAGIVSSLFVVTTAIYLLQVGNPTQSEARVVMELLVLNAGFWLVVARLAKPELATEGVSVPQLAAPTLSEAKGDFAGFGIACSGGGIRSAAFCLGGLQRLMDERSGKDPRSLYEKSQRVYAVSGGGHLATGIHLARVAASPDDDRQPFAECSPEEDWLRRKSSYLLPSRANWFRGLFSLSYGIAINLALLGLAIYFLARWTAWASQVLVTYCPGPSDPSVECFNQTRVTLDLRAAGTEIPMAGWVLVGSMALFALYKVVDKYWGTSAHNRHGPDWLASSGVLLVLLFIATPVAITALHNAATNNEPTDLIARAIAATGLVDHDACEAAVRQDFTTQAALAWNRSGDPEETTIPFNYGACGKTYEDNAAVFAPSQFGGTAESPGGIDAYECPDLSDPPESEVLDDPVPGFCADPNLGDTGPLSALTSILAVIAALATLIRGIVGQSDVKKSDSMFARLWAAIRRTALPWFGTVVVFVIVFAVFISIVRSLTYREDLQADWTTAAIAVGLYLAVRTLSDAKVSSLQPFFKDRLSDTFLVTRNDDGQVVPLPRDKTAVYTSAATRGPQLSVLCSANISDIDYVPAQRGCVPFRFETDTLHLPDHPENNGYIGITDFRLPSLNLVSGKAGAPRRERSKNPDPGPDHRLYAGTYSRLIDPNGVDTTLADAMAASGAAFSPIVGRMSKRVRPYRFLMALANARLGSWLRNPYLAHVYDQKGPDPRSRWQPRLSRFFRPGPFRLLKEAFGRQSILDNYIYVSDGGHFDNTGIVEALRDKHKVIVAMDASSDAEDSLNALADAITTARMDLALIVQPANGEAVDAILRKRDADTQPSRATKAWLHLKVCTVADPQTTVAEIFFVKNILTMTPGLELDAYALEHSEFPRTTTVNQFYGEYDFEAYRRLGFDNTVAMLSDMSDRIHGLIEQRIQPGA